MEDPPKPEIVEPNHENEEKENKSSCEVNLKPVETDQQKTNAQPPKEPTVTKRAMANEMYNRLKSFKSILIISMVLLFVLASVPTGWVSAAIAGVACTFLGFLLYKNLRESKYLVEKYNLTVKSFKIEDD